MVAAIKRSTLYKISIGLVVLAVVFGFLYKVQEDRRHERVEAQINLLLTHPQEVGLELDYEAFLTSIVSEVIPLGELQTSELERNIFGKFKTKVCVFTNNSAFPIPKGGDIRNNLEMTLKINGKRVYARDPATYANNYGYGYCWSALVSEGENLGEVAISLASYKTDVQWIFSVAP